MSSFLVTTETYQLVANWIYSNSTSSISSYPVRHFIGTDFDSSADEVRVAALNTVMRLQQLNIRALEQRYPNDAWYLDGQSIIAPRAVSMDSHSVVFAVKQLQCIRYQLSEGTVPKHPLFKKLDKFIGNLCEQLIDKMPEYDQAPWGL